MNPELLRLDIEGQIQILAQLRSDKRKGEKGLDGKIA